MGFQPNLFAHSWNNSGSCTHRFDLLLTATHDQVIASNQQRVEGVEEEEEEEESLLNQEKRNRLEYEVTD